MWAQPHRAYRSMRMVPDCSNLANLKSTDFGYFLDFRPKSWQFPERNRTCCPQFDAPRRRLRRVLTTHHDGDGDALLLRARACWRARFPPAGSNDGVSDETGAQGAYAAHTSSPAQQRRKCEQPPSPRRLFKSSTRQTSRFLLGKQRQFTPQVEAIHSASTGNLS